jgi:hypothetical protein
MFLADYQPPWWVSAAFGAVFGALAGLTASVLATRYRLERLHCCLDLKPQDRAGSRVTARVCNGYVFPLTSVWAYITITHELSDILPPPNGVEAYVWPHHPKLVQEDRLCWSFAGNPAFMDIYPGEKQSLDIANFDLAGKWIEIPSEDGWGSELGKRKSSRVFLKWKKYDVTVKIVSKDTRAKKFAVQIDPDNAKTPLSLR